MPGKSSSLSNQILALIFNGTGITGLAINATSAPLTTLYVALHTADPTATGTQSSSEAAYTGYARVAIARTTAGWTVTGASVSPAAAIFFPIGTGGSGTATNWSVGEASTGATEILYTGAITPPITLGNGVTPELTAASAITEQ